MRKKLNPYVGVRKISEKYKIIIGFNYEESVKNRQIKEGVEQIDTNPTERPQWFSMVSKSLVTDNKTGEKFYLRYQYLSDSTLRSKYRFNGRPIKKSKFEEFLIDPSNYENQGLENPLKFQVCDLRNITEISLMGNHYILTD